MKKKYRYMYLVNTHPYPPVKHITRVRVLDESDTWVQFRYTGKDYSCGKSVDGDGCMHDTKKKAWEYIVMAHVQYMKECSATIKEYMDEINDSKKLIRRARREIGK